MRLAPRIVALVLGLAAIGRSVGATTFEDPPGPVSKAETPISIFLNTPADLDGFWKSLARPDFVVLDGETYRKLRQSIESPGPAKKNPSAVVESLEVTGRVTGDLASLVVEYRTFLAIEGPTWVPIQLDGATLTEVRDGSENRPTRISPESKGWQVELKGRGSHTIRVELLAPVRSTVDGRRIELAVPMAASTRVDLVIPANAVEGSAGLNEGIGLTPSTDHRGMRFLARLSPRARLDLAWRERLESAGKLPTLLSAQGEISLEIERGSIRSRSSWILGAIRGSATELTLRLDSAEELLETQVDGKPVQVESRREGARTLVTIPLESPLRPESSRTLLLTTRRPIAPTGTARVALQGYSFDQAREQKGAVAIARTGPIFINSSPGRGLRRIDPRTKLPENLRGRPDTTLAFEFDEQPFDLDLRVEPAPARLRVGSRTTATIGPQSARLYAKLDCRPSQGKVLEVQVVLPRGLEFEGAEPREVVETTEIVPLDADNAPSPGAEAARVATIRLTPQAYESEAFSLILKGWCAIDPSRPVALPVFRPRVDLSEEDRYAIVTDRNVAVEPVEPAEGASAYRVDWGSPPTDWPWPARKPGLDLGLLWLRSIANPESIPLKVTVRPRSIRHESTLSALVDRRGAEVVEEIGVEVAFGVVSRLDLALSAEIPARWEVEGLDLAGREPLPPDPGGSRRYRLKFARDYSDPFRFRIRYRLPFADPPVGDRPGQIRLEPIRILEGSSTGRRVVIAADSRFDLRPEAKGWDPSALPDLATSTDGPPVRLSLSTRDERPGPIDLRIVAGPQLAMPGVIVSRLWIKAVQGLDDQLETSARFWVESRDGSLRVALPPGSTWVKARVGGLEIGEGSVEILKRDEYRFKLPGASATGPVLVTIDFVVPAAESVKGWPTVRLIGDGIVQRTIWEVQVPGSRAMIGTPVGWTDENEWYWTGALWKRRPSKGPAELAHWLTGGSSRYRLGELLDSGESSGRQIYLFSRVGPPALLRMALLSRISLLLLCSGPVLALGLLVLARRPPPRWIASGLLLGVFAAGAMVEPDVLIVVVQSSLLGCALWISSLAMNWAIEKAGRAARSSGDAALIVAPSSTGSSMARPVPVGSDDSTAIRARPLNPSAVSTADHVVLIRSPRHELGESNRLDLDHP